jgi:hypothetical protein
MNLKPFEALRDKWLERIEAYDKSMDKRVSIGTCADELDAAIEAARKENKVDDFYRSSPFEFETTAPSLPSKVVIPNPVEPPAPQNEIVGKILARIGKIHVYTRSEIDKLNYHDGIGMLPLQHVLDAIEEFQPEPPAPPEDSSAFIQPLNVHEVFPFGKPKEKAALPQDVRAAVERLKNEVTIAWLRQEQEVDIDGEFSLADDIETVCNALEQRVEEK